MCIDAKVYKLLLTRTSIKFVIGDLLHRNPFDSQNDTKHFKSNRDYANTKKTVNCSNAGYLLKEKCQYCLSMLTFKFTEKLNGSAQKHAGNSKQLHVKQLAQQISGKTFT